MNVCAVRTYGSSWLEPRIASPKPHESDGREFDIWERVYNNGVDHMISVLKKQFRCKHCGSIYMEDSK